MPASRTISRRVCALESGADGKAVAAKMKKMQTDDVLFGKGDDRADGRKIARRLSVRGEEAVGIEVSGRLLQAEGHHPGRGGVPSAQGWRLPAGERLMHQKTGQESGKAGPLTNERGGIPAC